MFLTNGPTVFTLLSHVTARLPHAVSRLPDYDAAARLLDAADRLTPSLPTFLPHGPARPVPVLVLPSPLHPLSFLPCLHGGKVDRASPTAPLSHPLSP
jgi:hypothetical protein